MSLKAAGIEFYAAPVGSLGEGLFVTLQREQVEAYVALMQHYLQPDNWNEIVGGRWLFIFSDGVHGAGFGRIGPGDPGEVQGNLPAGQLRTAP